MTHEDFLIESVNEARFGMHSNHGGPFGAVVVLEGNIVGRGHNMVTSANDPTAHAEILAIRNACRNLNRYHLEDAVLYTSCEPCPMCMAAVYWANIKHVYYSSDRNDAKRIGFNDKFIYDELQLPIEKRSLSMIKIPLEESNEIFEDWIIKQDKTAY